MWEKEITITGSDPGRTLKELLTSWRIPRRLRGQLRQQRRVTINGVYQPTSTTVKAGDVIRMQFEAKDFAVSDSNYVADDSQAIEVLFENDDLLVVNKFRGVKTHPNSPGETGTMMNFVQAYLTNQPGKAAYMVHRLDGETTGALMVAKTPVVVPMLNAFLKEKVIQRTYLAWVAGAMSETSGKITLPIGIDPLDDRKRVVDPAGLSAVTNWTLVHQVFQYSLLRVILETGRTHQIRVHLSAIGHPIVGDNLYFQADTTGYPLLLHAAAINIVIPFTSDQKSIAAPRPADFPVNLKN